MQNKLVAVLCFLFSGVWASGQSSLYLSGGTYLYADTGAVICVSGDLKTADSGQFKNYGELVVTGDLFHESGELLFSEDTGLLSLNGTVLQSIEGDLRLFDFELDNAAGAQMVSGKIDLINAFYPTSGTFTSNDSFYLKSSLNRTARVAESQGGNTAGDFVVERYLSTGSNAWRMIAAPLIGATIIEWEDDFYTSGYTGSQYPWYWFVSVAFYDETIVGEFDSGYVFASNTSNSVSAGTGAWAYIGPLPDTFDAKGELLFGSHDFGVTHTNGGVSSDHDGWNLLGNPYASAIDWDAAGWTKTNMNDAVYIWNGEAGQFQSYINGVGTNGGSSIIPSSQSFFVQSNASSPQLICTESVKTADQTPFVYKPIQQQFIRFRLNAGHFQDEAIIRFIDDATTGFDGNFDAGKAVSQETYSPSIYSTLVGLDFSINTLPMKDELIIPIKFSVNWPDTYEFTIPEIKGLSALYCFQLIDTLSEEKYPIDTAFHLTLNLDTGIVYNHFQLRAFRSASVASKATSCFENADGVLEVHRLTTDSSFLEIWKDSELILSDSGQADLIVQGLGVGQYQVEVIEASCTVQRIPVEITSPNQLMVNAIAYPDTSENRGAVKLDIYGGTEPYFVQWTHPMVYAGDSISNLRAGQYYYQVQDENDCEYFGSVVVQGNATEAEQISRVDLQIYPNPAKEFLHINGDYLSLDFQVLNLLGEVVKSGTISSENKKVRVYDLSAGSYFIRLSEYNLTFKFIKQ